MFGMNSDKRTIAEEQRGQRYTQQDMTLRAGLTEDNVDLSRAHSLAEDNQRYSEDFEDEKMEALDHALRNHVKDDKGNWTPRVKCVGRNDDGKYVYIEMAPKLNDEGIQDVLSLAQPFFHRNLINANLSEDEKNFILQKTKRVLRQNLIVKRNFYGLGNEPSTAHLRLIIDLFMNHVKPTPSRAVNDGERRHKRQYVKKLEASFEGVAPPKKNKLW